MAQYPICHSAQGSFMSICPRFLNFSLSQDPTCHSVQRILNVTLPQDPIYHSATESYMSPCPRILNFTPCSEDPNVTLPQDPIFHFATESYMSLPQDPTCHSVQRILNVTLPQDPIYLFAPESYMYLCPKILNVTMTCGSLCHSAPGS